MQYTEAKLGRIFIIRLHDGDHLPDILESFAAEKKIKGALCFILGGVKDKGRIIVGPLDGDVIPPTPILRILSGVHEVFGVGTLFLNESQEPRLHMHASFGRRESVTTGCIREGIDVWQVAEIVVLEITDATALRRKDKATGFDLLEVE